MYRIEYLYPNRVWAAEYIDSPETVNLILESMKRLLRAKVIVKYVPPVLIPDEKHSTGISIRA
jgi:hypothetical protein